MLDKDKLKEHIKKMVYEILEEDGEGGGNVTDASGAAYSTPKAFKKKHTHTEDCGCLKESIAKVIEKELLNEGTYSQFRNELKFRTKSEQLHKGIREIKRKLQEIDRIVEYTDRMKQELSEGEEGLPYWKATSNNIGKINEMMTEISNKIKKLHQ